MHEIFSFDDTREDRNIFLRASNINTMWYTTAQLSVGPVQHNLCRRVRNKHPTCCLDHLARQTNTTTVINVVKRKYENNTHKKCIKHENIQYCYAEKCGPIGRHNEKSTNCSQHCNKQPRGRWRCAHCANSPGRRKRDSIKKHKQTWNVVGINRNI